MNTDQDPQHLVALAIGPVQSFIEAARRTRDLWAGSQLLSQMAQGLCTQLVKQGATPIFPDPPTGAGSGPGQVVSNKVLVLLPLLYLLSALFHPLKEQKLPGLP